MEEVKFIDAEMFSCGELTLKQNAPNSYRNASQLERENRLRYYELLGSHFHDEEFTDNVERLVMERRANGIKIKVISEELEAKGERCHRQTIRLIIQKYEVKWGILKK